MKIRSRILSVIVALSMVANTVMPVTSETLDESKTVDPVVSQETEYTEYTEDYATPEKEPEEIAEPVQQKTAYRDGKILIYDYEELLLIGSGATHAYEDGTTAVYSNDAEYMLANDIKLPRHTTWQLPEGFTGRITGADAGAADLYDKASDTIYLFNPYQLAVMASETRGEEPVMTGDAVVSTFGSGQVICTDEEGKTLLTYGEDRNYVISSAFSSDVTEKPISVVENKGTNPNKGANNNSNNSNKEPKTLGSAPNDGRDFEGQVIKKINGVTYILIGNADQLRAIGSDREVFTAVYQTDYVAFVGHVLDVGLDGKPIQLYGGDADLLSSQNGYRDYAFQGVLDRTAIGRYYVGVDQETGEPYTDATHATTNKDSLTEASWRTGEKYTTKANYIIFRDIDLTGSTNPWKPLMFNGTMYGIKSVNGEKLWNGSTITDATALGDMSETNRPAISNIYIDTDGIYSDRKLRVNDFIGIGFFATITNRTDTANIGVSGGTAIVKNIDLVNVHVENKTNDAMVDQTLLNAVTSGLGVIVGALLDGLLTVLSFGSASTDLQTTLSNLLNARAQDPTIYATGAFAGRIYGDALVEDCRVRGTVYVSNAKDRTGGFVGYAEGLTEYSGLSTVLGVASEALAAILNVIPAIGLGDLITILLDNALPVGSLIPTDYIAPRIRNCAVEGLTATVGKTDTNMNGGFIGQQIGTRIEGSTVSESSFEVRAKKYGGGFAGLMRDAEIKGTLDGVGIDLSSIIQKIHPQGVIVDSSISDSAYSVMGETFLGGFVGAMTSSYAADCTIDCENHEITVSGTDEYAGGFAGYMTVGWQSSLGREENNEKSLLGTVRQLATGLLSTDKAAGQKLLTLMGISPSAVLGAQVYAKELNVSAENGFAGGLVGKGEGSYLGKSDQAAYDVLYDWNSGDIKETPANKPVILTNLETVASGRNYAGGVAGYMGSAAFQGLLNDVVGLGDFIGFEARDITVTGVTDGYTVTAAENNAGGGFGLAVGGMMKNIHLNALARVEANSRAGGFVGIAGPGELAGTGGLTVNLLGLDRVLAVSNLLNIGEGLEVKISNSTVTGVTEGYTVEATGAPASAGDVTEFKASGFIADSNSTEILNSHAYNLKSVTANARNGFAGGFIGTSTTGGLAEAAGQDTASVKSLIQADGLLSAIEYLIPDYTDCTVTFVNGGFVDADIAGGFVADMESGNADNGVAADADGNPIDISVWTRTTKELYDPEAVNATGDLAKQFAVFNIDRVNGRTYGGGFAGKLRSGALASAGGGISILGDSELGLNININDLLNVMNAYIPFVSNAGVYSENGFTVSASEVRDGDTYSGSAGGFAGYMSGAQVKMCDVLKLKHTVVTPPADLESDSASSYFDSSASSYAVTGGHFAGGYVGCMDIGSAASVGKGLKVLGESIALTNAVSALSVVVTTIGHSDVQGAGGGFSVLADGVETGEGKVGTAGGFAGAVLGGHIQNSHCKNFYYVIGEEYAGGYVGNLEPGDVAKLLDDASILGSLVNVDTALASLVQSFIPTIRNSTTSCVPCGGAVRADAASDAAHQRGVAGGYVGHNEGGHIWGLNQNTWKDENDGTVGNNNYGHNTEGNYTGEKHKAAAWRIRSVYGREYAGGFTGYMESADTADTGSIKLLGGLLSVDNVLTALSAVYPTEEHTAVYGPLENTDLETWNLWVEYVGKYGGYGIELSQAGTAASQAELNAKLSRYIYGTNVVAGRSAHEALLITEGGIAGGYVGYMVSGVITDGQAHDTKLVKALRAAGGYAGKMVAGGAASFGSFDLLGLQANLGNLVKALSVFVPTVKSGSVNGWKSGMTVIATGTDFVHQTGYAGGYAGAVYGGQIWGDANASGYAAAGCHVRNLRYVRGRNAAGGFVGFATAGSVADVNTNASKDLLQRILNALISSPANLASVLQATLTTIRNVSVSGDNAAFGFIVEGTDGVPARTAGGFAGSLEAAVIGKRKGGATAVVNGLRKVDGLYYAGGFVGLADVGSVATVSNNGNESTTILALINAGAVDLLDIFRTYIYDASVIGVGEGITVRASSAASEGLLSEVRYTGCAGGFAGGMMNGSIKRSTVTNLNTVLGLNYNGGFIGHAGRNGIVDVDSATVASLIGATAGVLDIFGTVMDECEVTGYAPGFMVTSTGGQAPISGGFAGYADVSQIKNSRATNLKQVYSDGIAGGFVGKTDMHYLIEVEASSPLVQLVLKIVNALVKLLYVVNLENLGLINLDSDLLGLRVLADGDLLYVNLLGLRIGVSLVKAAGGGVTDTALVTIGDSTVALPCTDQGIDMNNENAEVVVNLIKGNRTKVESSNVKGIETGYHVYGGGANDENDGASANGYAGGFVGYNNEGKLTDNKMERCDVVRGTAGKVGPFSGTTSLLSVYSFNTIQSIEGDNNTYSVYRKTTLKNILTSSKQKIGTDGEEDGDYLRYDVTHLAAPLVQADGEGYSAIFEKWDGAILSSNDKGSGAVPVGVYESSAKAVLMSDTPIEPNDESLIPDPGEGKDPCDETMNITIQKIWMDNNNGFGARPAEIRVRIIRWSVDASGDTVPGSDVVYTDDEKIPDMDANGWFSLTAEDHGREGAATWVRMVEGLPVHSDDDSVYYEYTVEEAAVTGYTTEIIYDDTGETETATITNTKTLEIQFKYYDRYELNGVVAGIDSTETAYSFIIKSIPEAYLYFEGNVATAKSIDFMKLIADKAVEFRNNGLLVNNVMCEYELWTSQYAAEAAMANLTYFVDGEPVSYGTNTTYHTDYLGRPLSSGEKWVNYYDEAGNVIDTEALASGDNHLKVAKIVVWCYNYPRTYNVSIHGANSVDDVVERMVDGKLVYVADKNGSDTDVVRLDDKYYYNQRFGGALNDADLDDGGFIDNYGLPGYSGISPADYAAASFDDYVFAYWAYDEAGTQIASVDRYFRYRVGTDTELYAVYTKEAFPIGISISANTNDTYVDSNGVSRTRLNIIGSIFGAEDYDTRIQKISFVNISLSTQVRENPEIYTPEKINALFEQYKDELKELIRAHDEAEGSKSFKGDETFNAGIDEETNDISTVLQLTLTTKGFIYTVISNGNTAENGDATATLTNKNRVHFTMDYKTTALNIDHSGSKGNTCLVYCGALKCNDEWQISTNCLIYFNGEVVSNSATDWE